MRRRWILLRKARYENVWPIDERAGKKPEGWSGWPDQKRFAFVLLHDVDTERGQGNCRDLMRLDEEMGFCSLFSFVPERYAVSSNLREELARRGFEVGVHGLKHDGRLYRSKAGFLQRAERINHYLQEWDANGFRSPSMQHNLDWFDKYLKAGEK